VRSFTLGIVCGAVFLCTLPPFNAVVLEPASEMELGALRGGQIITSSCYGELVEWCPEWPVENLECGNIACEFFAPEAAFRCPTNTIQILDFDEWAWSCHQDEQSIYEKIGSPETYDCTLKRLCRWECEPDAAGVWRCMNSNQAFTPFQHITIRPCIDDGLACPSLPPP
jgi:hypothetical protein